MEGFWEKGIFGELPWVLWERIWSSSASATRSCALLGERIMSSFRATQNQPWLLRDFLHLNVFEILRHQETTSLADKVFPLKALVDVKYFHNGVHGQWKGE